MKADFFPFICYRKNRCATPCGATTSSYCFLQFTSTKPYDFIRYQFVIDCTSFKPKRGHKEKRK